MDESEKLGHPNVPGAKPARQHVKGVSLRRAFFTGLAALLPTAVTIIIIVWLVGLVMKYVAEPINGFLVTLLDLFVQGDRTRAHDIFYHQNGHGWFTFEWAGFVVALAVTLLAGFMLLTFVGRRFYRVIDRLLSRVPILRMIYPHVKQLTDFIFSADKVSAFRQVVMIEYPRRGTWSIGFVTGLGLSAARTVTGEDLVSVFIPSSPTPFTGYVVAIPRREAVVLPISVDEALRFTISGGVLVPPRQRPKLNGPSRDEDAAATEDSTEH